MTWERERPAAELNALGSRFTKLDVGLREVVAAFSDDDLAKPVHRPGGFHLPVDMQLDAYLQAMLISASLQGVRLPQGDGLALPPAMLDWIW